jgi:hypothetical protein
MRYCADIHGTCLERADICTIVNEEFRKAHVNTSYRCLEDFPITATSAHLFLSFAQAPTPSSIHEEREILAVANHAVPASMSRLRRMT